MLSFPPAAGFLFLSALSTVAQLPSSSWRKATVTTSSADRVSIAGAAIEKAIAMVGSDGQFNGEGYAVAGTFYYQLAEFDIVTNGTNYQKDLLQYFPLAQAQSRVNFSDGFLQDSLTYGYAAVRAYTAYNVTLLLQYAIQSWWSGRAYTLSQANIDAGRIPTKNFSIEGLCQDITMAGGTFYTTNLNNTAINGLGTGYFALVSALLAEATSDPMYLQAAQESTEFIHAHLYNIQNVVQDSISALASDSCAVSSIIEPYNSGLMIEALAVLASITRNSSTQALLGTILEAAIGNAAWQGSNGIISNTGHGSEGDISLVRGLAAAYSRNVTTPALRAYIADYLAVQFNAAIDLSTSGNNIYGAAWIGPPSSIFLGANQTTALAALISAITLHNDTNISPTTSGSSPSTPSGSKNPNVAPRKASSSGPIVGGVVGALAFLGLGFALWFICRRYSRSRRTTADSQIFSMRTSDSGRATTSVIHPFTETSSSPPTTISRPIRMAQQGGRATAFHRKHPSSSTTQPTSITDAPTATTDAPTATKDVPTATPDALTAATDATHADQAILPAHQRSANTTAPSPSVLPTEELVRLLNERLRNQEWDEGEAPPEYPVM